MNSISVTPVIAISLALAVAGCANLRWQKDGADPALTEKVLAQCEQQAMLRARSRAASMPPIPTVVGGPGGASTVMVPSHDRTSDLVAQQSMLSECMRAKGYQLVREDEKK